MNFKSENCPICGKGHWEPRQVMSKVFYHKGQEHVISGLHDARCSICYTRGFLTGQITENRRIIREYERSLKDYISPSDVYKIREKYMLSLVAADHKFNLESGSFSRWEDGEPVPPEIAFVLIEVLDRDDVIVRKEYLIENQGRCITPMTIKVKVVCVDETTVWYTKEGDPRVYDTTVERFTEILRGNQK